jgi:hypothetical protein
MRKQQLKKNYMKNMKTMLIKFGISFTDKIKPIFLKIVTIYKSISNFL